MRRPRFIFGALLAVLWATPLRAQQPTGTIRGRVIDDATQQPLSAVTVTVGSRGARTQADGGYLIGGVPAGTDTLRARLLGYAPATRPVTVVGGQTLVVDLAMTAQAIGLSEIVVVGYGEQSAGNITGAVSQVGTAEFNPGRIISPALLIQNKVAGVQVVDNNEPGGGLSVRIRGTTSINASSEPLYVIDGMPVGNYAGGGLSAGRDPLNFLNPDDIETITVLRDASAAAIYGANAANGVVLIRTKSGRRGPQVEYGSSMSASSVTRLPDMLNATQFRAAVTQYAPQNVNQLSSASTNWFDLVSRTAYGQDHNLAVSGTGETSSYRLSLGYLNQDGIIRGTTTERLSLGLNYTQRLFNDRLVVRTNLRGSRALDRFTPGGVLSNAAQMGPTQPVTDTTVTGYYDWPGSLLTSADNPVAILALATDRGTTLRSVGSLQAEYRAPFLEGLKANLNLGFDAARADRAIFTPSLLHSQLKTGNGGSDFRRNDQQLNSVLEAYLSYAVPASRVPGTLDLAGGYSYSQSQAEYPWFLAQGLSTDLLGGNGVTAARQTQNFQDIQNSRLISFFGRANYNIGDRYLVALSVRRDGSSRFGPSNAWGTFPSVALAWRISQEPFMSGFRSLSDLKLRVSKARTGNQAFANYQPYATYLVGDAQTQVQFGTEYVSTIRPGAVDRNIRWEETSSTNFGLDFGFLNQRISGSVEWYTKNTDDLIFTVPVAAGTNLSNFLTTNIGSMRNRGVELSLSARLLDRGRSGGLSWTADFTAARNTNELTSINPRAGSAQILTGGIAGGVGTTIQLLEAGQPINSFFVYQHRLGADGKPVYATGANADSLMYVDQNADGIINVDDRRPFHDPRPKWILGHSSYLTYGNFDF
ncbi:MAG: SusC/RagA family TonB-linked outer membrane protein, partial [Gemmatimonadota bacterium]